MDKRHGVNLRAFEVGALSTLFAADCQGVLANDGERSGHNGVRPTAFTAESIAMPTANGGSIEQARPEYSATIGLCSQLAHASGLSSRWF